MVIREDLHKDVFLDVVKSIRLFHKAGNDKYPDFDHKKLPGYIQEIQAYPAKAVLYSALQMSVLKQLSRQGRLNLMLDGTGGLIRSLSEPYDTSRLLLYTLLAQTPKGIFNVPAMEVIAPDATHANVVTWLFNFFEA